MIETFVEKAEHWNGLPFPSPKAELHLLAKYLLNSYSLQETFLHLALKSLESARDVTHVHKQTGHEGKVPEP